MPSAAWQYTVPPPGMPSGPVIQPQGLMMMRIPSLRLGSEQGKAVRPTHYEHGESSECHEYVSHRALKWNVYCFLKNGGSLFTGVIDLEVTLVWFDDTEVVLEQMVCTLNLWV